MKRIHALALSLALAAGMPALAQAADFAVIVNAENPFSADEAGAKAQVARLFLKQQTQWPGGTEAVPFARDAGSPEQSAFEASILGMSAAEQDDHWKRLKQTTGEAAPRGVGSTSILVRQVAKNPGAFGVISLQDAGKLGAGAKVLLEF